MKRVEVTWVDSCSPERYWNWDVDGKADLITTVGYIARRDKKTISLVASIGSRRLQGRMGDHSACGYQEDSEVEVDGPQASRETTTTEPR
jgi:hypothetical protein